MSKKIKILIIDDSAVTRAVLERILSLDKDIEVVGTAIDPIFAVQKIKKFRPDVITLDLEMPRMDGLTFLKKIMRNQPIPTVVISGNSPKSSRNAIKALEYGAMEIIEKPDISSPEKLQEVSNDIVIAVKAAYSTLKDARCEDVTTELETEQPTDTFQNSEIVNFDSKEANLIVIGSSTGGPDVIKQILTKLPSNLPPIVIAQHMPALFTNSFAERLNNLCEVKVSEATDGEVLNSGQVFIIPGGFHGQIRQDINGLKINLNQEAKVNRHRPSVDVLFNSAVKINPTKTVGILLTGMGDDGARGLKNLKDSGAFTIAQNRESSAVFGMPKRAIEMEATLAVLAPDDIATLLNQKVLQKR